MGKKNRKFARHFDMGASRLLPRPTSGREVRDRAHVKARHERRVAFALANAHALIAWCDSRGISATHSRDGIHWRFRGPGRFWAVWVAVKARLVMSNDPRQGEFTFGKAHEYEQVIKAISAMLESVVDGRRLYSGVPYNAGGGSP